MSEAICEECGKPVTETHAPCQSGMILGQPCRPGKPSEESEKPKAEGWYWRLPEDGGDDLADRPEVVEIYDSADEDLLVDFHRLGQRSLANIPGSFVGPLTPDDFEHLTQGKARAEAAERCLEELGREVGRALVAATLGEQERLADRKDPEHAIVACVLGLKDELFEAERELTACRSELSQSTADTIRLSQQLDRMRALVAEFEAQDDHEADDPGKLLSKLLRELNLQPAKSKQPARYHTDGCPAVYGTSQSTTTCAVWCRARKENP